MSFPFRIYSNNSCELIGAIILLLSCLISPFEFLQEKFLGSITKPFFLCSSIEALFERSTDKNPTSQPFPFRKFKAVWDTFFAIPLRCQLGWVHIPYPPNLIFLLLKTCSVSCIPAQPIN